MSGAARTCDGSTAFRKSAGRLLELTGKPLKESCTIRIGLQTDNLTPIGSAFDKPLELLLSRSARCHMYAMNSGSDRRRSGQPSAMSGRVLPKPTIARRTTRQSRCPTGRSSHNSMLALASRLGHVAECLPSNTHRSCCSASRQRRVFSALLRSTQPGCQCILSMWMTGKPVRSPSRAASVLSPAPGWPTIMMRRRADQPRNDSNTPRLRSAIFRVPCFPFECHAPLSSHDLTGEGTNACGPPI